MYFRYQRARRWKEAAYRGYMTTGTIVIKRIYYRYRHNEERVRLHHLGIFSRACCRTFCLFKRTEKEKQAGSAFKTSREAKMKKDTHSYATLLFLAPCQGQLSVPTKEGLDSLEHCICVTLCRIIDIWIIQQVLNP